MRPSGETMTMAPLIVDGRVFVGNSGGELGVRGWITALNLKDGNIVWQAYNSGPDADVKIFLVASPEVRARRRAAQLVRTSDGEYQAILADIRRRDERDINRAAAPLRPAEDAHLLDTSQMDIEAAFRAAVDIVDRALKART